MWVQVVSTITALVAAVSAMGLGIASFVRSGRAEDAQLRTGSTEVGLRHIQLALDRAESDIKRLLGEVGRLQGQLEECLRQRGHQEEQLMRQAREIEQLKQSSAAQGE